MSQLEQYIEAAIEEIGDSSFRRDACGLMQKREPHYGQWNASQDLKMAEKFVVHCPY
jgi:hypothetical protein